MPVRKVFLVIGSVAVVGVVGAVVLRETHGPGTAAAGFAANASESRTSTSGAAFSAMPDESVRIAQARQSGAPAPRVILPGAVPAPQRTTPAPTGSATPDPAAGNASAASDSDSGAALPRVDETALRYFARQGDTKRLNAEIARLRALYPDWYPPTDMTEPMAIPDPQLDRMWKLYSEGQYAAVRAAIADRLVREPNWKVPDDLLNRLNVGEARDRLANAASAKQWSTVLQIAATTPSLLTCADVDVLWQVAEAFAATKRTERARDVGIYILTNCQDPKERLATVQKAMQYLSDSELAELMALERTDASGKGEFDSIKADLARRRVGAAAKDKNAIASADDLAIIERLAQEGPKADDAVLLAGYLFQHGDIENAAKWYQLARTRADTPDIARGLAYSLNALDRHEEAEEAAYRWRDATPENKEAYLVVASALLAVDPPVKLDAAVVARIAKVISAEKYAPGARELGWYAYNTGQPLAAAQWFTAALTWKPDDEPSAFGLALCYDKLGAKTALQKVIKIWGPKSQRIADLGDPRARKAGSREVLPMPPSIADPQRQSALAPSVREVSDRVVAVPGPDGRIAEEPQLVALAPVRRQSAESTAVSSGGGGGGRNCTDHVPASSLSGGRALSRGWCLLDLNRPIEASDAFEAAMRSTSGKQRSDAAYGKTLADLRAGLTDRAAVAASAAPQDEKRRVAMQSEIMTQRALAAYGDGRYVETLFYLDERSRIAPEQNDLLMIRGWAYFHLHRVPEAKRIFVSVAGTGSREALRALAAIAADKQGSTVGDVRDRR